MSAGIHIFTVAYVAVRFRCVNFQSQFTSGICFSMCAPGYRQQRQVLIPIIMTTERASSQSEASEPRSASPLASRPAGCCGMSISNLPGAMHIALHTSCVRSMQITPRTCNPLTAVVSRLQWCERGGVVMQKQNDFKGCVLLVK